jgi:DNA mismatch repair protein MSH4
MMQSGVSGLLDVARQTFKEATEDVHQHVTDINSTSNSELFNRGQGLIQVGKYELQAELRYDNTRRYWLRINENSLDGRTLSSIFINQFRKKGYIECQTLDLMKLNQRIEDSHQEVVLMSDKSIQQLVDDIRIEIPRLFRVCESISMLDMIASFRFVFSSLSLLDDIVQI